MRQNSATGAQHTIFTKVIQKSFHTKQKHQCRTIVSTGASLMISHLSGVHSRCVMESIESDEIVVLLSLLNEQILSVDEVVGSNHLVEGCHLFLVHTHAAALSQFAHFAL